MNTYMLRIKASKVVKYCSTVCTELSSKNTNAIKVLPQFYQHRLHKRGILLSLAVKL